MADLAGWPYWKVISITGQSGAGTDYQTKFTIGDSAGGDFHLEGHCTNFPQDIRITDDDGTTLLDHFVEDLTADPIVVHVEVKDDLGSNQDIRVYYGKSGETTASNGANTFLQYHGSASANFIDSLVISPDNIVYQAKARATAATHNIRFGVGTSQLDNTGDSAYFISYSPLNRRYQKTVDNNVHTETYTTPSYTLNQWYALKTISTSTTTTFYIDGSPLAAGHTTNRPDTNLGLFAYTYDGTLEQVWSFARKYNSPEPAFSSAGAEQTPAEGHPTMRRWSGIPGMQYLGRRSW